MILTWVKSFSKPNEARRALFERLMADSYPAAYHMAYRLTSSRTEAEDLLQESYVRAFRFFNRYDEAMPFSSWLYRIMTNVHIDTVRRKSRIKTVSLDQPSRDGQSSWDFEDPQAGVEDQFMEDELGEPFQLGLKAMTPEFRTAVVLSDVEGMSYEEIAVIMETSVGTVRSRIHRGRKQLRAHLELHCPDLVRGVSG